MKRLLAVSASVLLGFVLALVFLLPRIPVRAGAMPSGSGDVNGDGTIDVSDAVFTLLFLFKGGPEPVACADSPEILGRVAALENTNERIAAALEEIAHPCRKRPDSFVDNGDGTVTDTCTGLMWSKRASFTTTDWAQATAYAEGIQLGGHEDWRLPTLQELSALVVEGSYPAADAVFGLASALLGVPEFWTSTESATTAGQYWGVSFTSGVTTRLRDLSNSGLKAGVLAVRGPVAP